MSAAVRGYVAGVTRGPAAVSVHAHESVAVRVPVDDECPSTCDALSDQSQYSPYGIPPPPQCWVYTYVLVVRDGESDHAQESLAARESVRPSACAASVSVAGVIENARP